MLKYVDGNEPVTLQLCHVIRQGIERQVLLLTYLVHGNASAFLDALSYLADLSQIVFIELHFVIFTDSFYEICLTAKHRLSET